MKEEKRLPIKEWARLKQINESTACHWAKKYLPPGVGVKIGTAIALTEQEFDNMVAEARRHKPGRPKKQRGIV